MALTFSSVPLQGTLANRGRSLTVLTPRERAKVQKMAIADQIRDRLSTAFTLTALDVINESHQHAGHSGDDGSGESHFRVVIAAPAFSEMTRLARHRAVHGAIGAELIASIHALALEIEG